MLILVILLLGTCKLSLGVSWELQEDDKVVGLGMSISRAFANSESVLFTQIENNGHLQALDSLLESL